MSIVKSKENMLRQVLLRKVEPTEGGGYQEDVFWIDNEVAKVGKKVCGDDGVVWKVIETYNAKPFYDIERQGSTWRDYETVLDDH